MKKYGIWALLAVSLWGCSGQTETATESTTAGIDVKGEIQLAADVKGVYNETSMPIVNAEIEYNKGVVSMPEMLPYPITNLNTSIKADLDLNNKSDVSVNYLNANMSNSSLSLSGTIKDVMDKMYCDINLNANADLDELQSFMPEGIIAKGMIRLNGNAKVNSHQLATMDFMKAKVNGNMQWENMNVIYCDTITVNSDLPEIIQKIIVAHELGHAVLHRTSSVQAFHEVVMYDSSSIKEKDSLPIVPTP